MDKFEAVEKLVKSGMDFQEATNEIEEAEKLNADLDKFVKLTIELNKHEPIIISN